MAILYFSKNFFDDSRSGFRQVELNKQDIAVLKTQNEEMRATLREIKEAFREVASEVRNIRRQ